MFSFDLSGHQAHRWYTDIGVGKTPIHIKIKINKWFKIIHMAYGEEGLTNSN